MTKKFIINQRQTITTFTSTRHSCPYQHQTEVSPFPIIDFFLPIISISSWIQWFRKDLFLTFQLPSAQLLLCYRNLRRMSGVIIDKYLWGRDKFGPFVELFVDFLALDDQVLFHSVRMWVEYVNVFSLRLWRWAPFQLFLFLRGSLLMVFQIDLQGMLFLFCFVHLSFSLVSLNALLLSVPLWTPFELFWGNFLTFGLKDWVFQKVFIESWGKKFLRFRVQFSFLDVFGESKWRLGTSHWFGQFSRR